MAVGLVGGAMNDRYIRGGFGFRSKVSTLKLCSRLISHTLIVFEMRYNMAYKEKSKAIEYNNSYNKEHYQRVSLMLPNGKKDLIKAKAEANNESLNAFINRAIDELLEKE